ncbi:hypothetical protein K440DRAFT_644722 [Wilcoxina mikolae CBS 423.85]|nr:hypothetical protein K440DRAFT_644722 [Wilcoxina mikolae CBS 423.85]
MATGFEIAGLALAIFRLVITGITLYRDAAAKIKDLHHYETVLKQLVRQLDIEKLKFENTCAFLLEGILPADQVAALVEGDISRWNDPNFQNELGKCLRVGAATAFTRSVEALNQFLQGLIDEIGFDEYLQPTLLDKKTRKRQWKKLKLILDKENHLAVLEDINRVNTDLQQLVIQRTKYRVDTSSLCQVAKHYFQVRDHAKNLYAVFRQRFKATVCHCRDPHIANLPLQITTADQIDHDRQNGLRLKVLFHLKEPNSGQGPHGGPSVRWKWRTLEFEPVECKQPTTIEVGTKPECSLDNTECGREDSSQSPPPVPTGVRLKGALKSVFTRQFDGEVADRNSIKAGATVPLAKVNSTLDSGRLTSSHATPVTKSRVKVTFTAAESLQTSLTTTIDVTIAHNQIENLCSAIRVGEGHATACIGILVDERNGWHRIWTHTKFISSPVQPEIVSLDNLLKPGIIDKKARLKLGVLLATAVLQLHNSNWLKENWGKGDIFFFQREIRRNIIGGGVGSFLEPIIDQPFVRGDFGNAHFVGRDESGAQTPQLVAPPSSLVDADMSLFSLGVVLFELWFEKPIQDFTNPQQLLESDFNQTCYKVAQGRIGELIKVAGPAYGLAVSHCIEGLSSSSRATRPGQLNSLEDMNFKNEVHANIICPLENNLKACDGYI